MFDFEIYLHMYQKKDQNSDQCNLSILNKSRVQINSKLKDKSRMITLKSKYKL